MHKHPYYIGHPWAVAPSASALFCISSTIKKFKHLLCNLIQTKVLSPIKQNVIYASALKILLILKWHNKVKLEK